MQDQSAHQGAGRTGRDACRRRRAGTGRRVRRLGVVAGLVGRGLTVEGMPAFVTTGTATINAVRWRSCRARPTSASP